jgi:hypothetical protein
MNLIKSPVVFNSEDHTYFLGDKQLSGITSVIHRHICPSKYDGIPKHILDKAAERGTLIHETCELVDDLHIKSELQEAINYQILCKENNLHYVCSEYLVSDNEHYATCIDKIFRIDDSLFAVELSDIKTTRVLDDVYLSWQLSINAYLFELQNPGVKVEKLSAIWLRDEKYKYVPVTRIPDAEVIALLTADSLGQTYTPPAELAKKENALEIPADLISEICRIQKEAEEATSKLEELKAGLLAKMKTNNVKSFDCDAFKMTYIAESTSQSFDSKRFKEEHKDMYDLYLKQTTRKESIKITFR